MSRLQFQYETFIQYYPQFANDVCYPKNTLQLYWNEATTIVNDDTRCSGLRNPRQLQRALNLMTAHLTVLTVQAAQGQTSGLVTGATVDKVSITLTPPPEVNQWQWWLNQTPYGQQFLALMQVAAVGGFFAGGYPTTFTMPR